MGIDEFSEFDFTERAEESFYGAVDDPYFRDKDLFLIYDALKTNLRLVPFGDYLKRYIYTNAELEGDYREIPLKDYQDIIITAFSEHSTPPSFTPTTARLSALSKNWLTQQTVKRSVVFLLGFGLGMSEADVNDFLTKALREQIINPKDPFELICGYCFRKGLSFMKYRALWEQFEAMPPAEPEPEEEDLYGERTVGVRSNAARIRNEAELLVWLRKMRRADSTQRQSIVAREAFDDLYLQARECVAAIYNETEADDRAHMSDRLAQELSNNSRLYDYEKARKLEKASTSIHRFTAEDITAGDIERVICSAVPMGSSGNLMPAKSSKLSAQFAGKRFSRQHVAEVLAGRAGIDRFDLITLNFFLYSQRLEQYPNPRRRYSSFIESSNRILDTCGMGMLYVANPYECFILMCLLSEDPLGTYADVWELSYQQE